MKKLIFLFVLLLLIASNTIFSQELQSYIVEFDTLVNLDMYMDSNKFVDKEKIKNDKNDTPSLKLRSTGTATLRLRSTGAQKIGIKIKTQSVN